MRKNGLRWFNPKRFIEAFPTPRPPSFWAHKPQQIPERIRRVADVYCEIARDAEGKQLPTAPAWRALASILEDAAAKAEGVPQVESA